MTRVSAIPRNWSQDDDAKLRKMAGAGWSVHMTAAQFNRLPYDVETRAALLGLVMSDRTAGKDKAPHCSKCNRAAGEACPYHPNFCTRKAAAAKVTAKANGEPA